MTAIRVLVNASNFERARTILVDFVRRDHEPSDQGNRCLSCRAPMGEAEKCAVCGWTYDLGSVDSSSPASDAPPVEEPPPAHPSSNTTMPAERRPDWGEVIAV